MIPIFAQIVQRLPGYLIERLAGGQKIKARAFSYSSQLYLLMLGQFLHAFSLNEIVNIAEVHRRKLSRIRGIGPAKLNTFSNANRTRDPAVAEAFYWALRDHFSSQSPDFRGDLGEGRPGRASEILLDSRTPGFQGRQRRNAVFAGLRETIPQCYWIAERQKSKRI